MSTVARARLRLLGLYLGCAALLFWALHSFPEWAEPAGSTVSALATTTAKSVSYFVV